MNNKAHRKNRMVTGRNRIILSRLFPLSSRLSSVLIAHKRKRIVAGLLIIALLVPIIIITILNVRSAEAAWWSGDGTGSWTKRKRLTITNNSGDNLASGTTVAITVNAKDLASSGKLQDDCDDLRVIYNTGSTQEEVIRYISVAGNATCGASGAAKVHFPLQAALNDGGSNSSTDYYIYYGNPSATAPTSTVDAFDTADDNALLVCPFDGTTECINGDGAENPTTESGAIRYGGGKSAVKLRGYGSERVDFGTPASLDNLPLGDLTVEWWQYWSNGGRLGEDGYDIPYGNYGCSGGGDGFKTGYDVSNRSFYSRYYFDGTTAETTSASNAVPNNEWSHIAVVFEASTKIISIYVNGSEVSYSSQTPGEGAYLGDDSSFYIGYAPCDSQYFMGIIDEFRISDVIRYTNSFTPSASPYTRDEHTKLLVHFDENGDDPRNTGKAIDDSGNGNHGTLQNGASYVSGLVGVNASTSDTGKANGGNTYAGHEGIFIEEATTNKITNPSFEHATYDTNWTASSSATFTENTNFRYYKFGSKSGYLVSSSAYYDLDNRDTHQGIYTTTSNKRLSQGFQSSTAISPTEAVPFLARWGSASRYLRAEIQTDSSGVPSGTPVANGTTDCIDYSTIDTYSPYTEIVFTFSTAPSLSASTQYHLVLRSFTDSGCSTEQSSADGTNYISWGYDNSSSTYSDGDRATMNESSVWTTQSSTDHIFALSQNGSVLSSINVGNINDHTLSAYIYKYSDWSTVGGAVDSTVARLMFDATPVDTTYTNMGGGWWRLSYSGTGVNGSTTYGVEALAGSKIFVDGVQLEELAYATTYTDGSLGTGYSWSGTENNSTSSKNDGNIRMATSGNINASSGTISMWVKPNWNGDDNVGHQLFTVPRTGGSNNNRIDLYKYTNNSTYFRVRDNVGSDTSVVYTNSTAFQRGEWHHLLVTWSSGSSPIMYFNGSSVGSPSGTGAPSSLYANFEIGSGSNTGVEPPSDHADAQISDLVIWDSALTSVEAIDLYYSGLVAHEEAIEVDAFSEEKGQNPVAIWHLDEGYGTTANDSSTYGNHLTLDNASWETQSVGARATVERYLSFDGTTSSASRSGVLKEFNFSTGSFSMGGWFRHSSSISGTDTILSRYGSSGYKVYMNSSGYICVGVDDDSSWGPDDEVCSTTTHGSLADSSWHHFEAVVDRDSSPTVARIYIDGLEANYIETLTATATVTSSEPIVIGADASDGTPDYWDGDIDELIVYPYARSADQVKTDVLGGSKSSVFGAHTQDWLTDGLVGYWPMEDNVSGDGQTIADSSGNGNDGTTSDVNTNGMDCTVAGRFGGGCDFEGNAGDDKIEFGNLIPTTDPQNQPGTGFTYSAWINIDDFSADQGAVVAKYDDDGFRHALRTTTNSSLQLLTLGGDGSGVITADNSLSTDTWHHVVATFADYDNSASLYIDGESSQNGTLSTGLPFGNDTFTVGRRADDGDELDGTVDEVRVYNRILSPAEVQDLYEWAPGSVGFFKLDENNGSTAYDSSGNEYNGTLQIGDSMPSWTIGKFGSGLDFDGGDRITGDGSEVLAAENAGTVTMWVKSDSPTEKRVMFASVVGRDKAIYTESGAYRAGIYDGGTCRERSGGTVSTDWQHVAYTWNSSTGNTYLYVDGIQVDSDDGSSWTPVYTESGTFYGGPYLPTNSHSCEDNDVSHWNGKIDDIRVYNYARTPAQIIEDMNAGHPAPGSPIGSSVLHLKFDEGYGDDAFDSSPQGNNGDLGGSGQSCPADINTSCPSWTNSGKFGKALNFDTSGSTDDYVDLGTISGHQFSDNFTVSAWANATSFSTWTGIVTHMYNASNRGWGLATDGSSTLMFALDSGAEQGFSTVDNNPPTGEWFHLVGVRRNGTNYVYLNGVQQSTTTTNVPDTGAVNTVVGRWRGDFNGLYFNGLIDEVKIYNFALTADQVKTEYNFGSAQVFGATGADTSGQGTYSAASEYCPPGSTDSCTPPVAEWKFDESEGTSAYDTSENNFTGSFNGSPTWTPSTRDSSWALYFDGNDYLNSWSFEEFQGLSALSLSAWIQPDFTPSDSTDRGIFNEGNDVFLHFDEGTDDFRFVTTTTSGAVTCTTDGLTWNTGEWYFITATYDGNNMRVYWNGEEKAECEQTGTVDTNPGYSGSFLGFNGTVSYFLGEIDSIKAYDYARTPAQIAWEYNRGGPVGWWKLDECSGTVANDSSGNGNNGTITPGAGTYTSAGTCGGDSGTEMWAAGASGKRNASLGFDGDDDYVDVGDVDTTSAITVAAWVKWNVQTSFDGIASKRTATENDGNWVLRMNSSGDGTLEWVVWESTSGLTAYSTSSIPTATWTHVTVTFDESTDTTKFYIDGQLDNTTTNITNNLTDNAEAIKIGYDGQGGGSAYFDGQIDDVRVYNYALTQQQINDIYSGGAVRFGP